MDSNYDIGKGLRILAIIVFVVFWAAAATFVISNMANKTYTAAAQLVVAAGLGTDPTGTGDVLNAPRIGATYAELATTRPVLLDVIKRADLPYDPVDLARLLAVSADPLSPFVTIEATDASPTRAAQIANALADILVERATIPATPATATPPTLGTPEQRILEIVERAVVPDEPSGPRVMFNTVLAAATALVFALATVAVLAYMGGERPVQSKKSGGRIRADLGTDPLASPLHPCWAPSPVRVDDHRD